MRITRARRDCSYPFRIGRRWSCWPTARSESCAPEPRRLRSFPLCTSSPRRRSERRASKGGHYTAQVRERLDKTWRADAQFASPPPSRVFNTYSRSDGDYLTGRAAGRGRPPPRAAVGGNWTHSPVTLLLCYGDSTPHCALLIVTVFRIHIHFNCHRTLWHRISRGYVQVLLIISLFCVFQIEIFKAALLFARRGWTENSWTSTDVGPVPHSYITNSLPETIE